MDSEVEKSETGQRKGHRSAFKTIVNKCQVTFSLLLVCQNLVVSLAPDQLIND